MWRGARIVLVPSLGWGLDNLVGQGADLQCAPIGGSGLDGGFWKGNNTDNRLEITSKSGAAIGAPFSVGGLPKRVVFLCRFRMQDNASDQDSVWSLGTSPTDGGPIYIATRKDGTWQQWQSQYVDSSVSLTDTDWHTYSYEVSRDDNSWTLSRAWGYLDGKLAIDVGAHNDSVGTGTTLYLAAAFGDASMPVDISFFAMLYDPFGDVISDLPMKGPNTDFHTRWHADPFGMIRPSKQVLSLAAFKKPAAVGDTSGDGSEFLLINQPAQALPEVVGY